MLARLVTLSVFGTVAVIIMIAYLLPVLSAGRVMSLTSARSR